MTALFVVMFLTQWEENKDHRPALIGVGCTALCLVVLGSDHFLLPAMGLIILPFWPCARPFPRSASDMTLPQQILTIAVVVLGTMTTRFLPFLLFPEGKQPPAFIRYLGTVLPSAVIGCW